MVGVDRAVEPFLSPTTPRPEAPDEDRANGCYRHRQRQLTTRGVIREFGNRRVNAPVRIGHEAMRAQGRRIVRQIWIIALRATCTLSVDHDLSPLRWSSMSSTAPPMSETSDFSKAYRKLANSARLRLGGRPSEIGQQSAVPALGELSPVARIAQRQSPNLRRLEIARRDLAHQHAETTADSS
jgi:hypothetical protein